MLPRQVSCHCGVCLLRRQGGGQYMPWLLRLPLCSVLLVVLVSSWGADTSSFWSWWNGPQDLLPALSPVKASCSDYCVAIGSNENKFPALFIAFSTGQTHFFSKKWGETRRVDVSTSNGQAFMVHWAALWVWIVALHYIEWKSLMLLCAFTLESHGHFKSLSPFLYFNSFPSVWIWTYLTE